MCVFFLLQVFYFCDLIFWGCLFIAIAFMYVSMDIHTVHTGDNQWLFLQCILLLCLEMFGQFNYNFYLLRCFFCFVFLLKFLLVFSNSYEGREWIF
ncbi:hypothetical protein FKM82_018854 [Ascaphus truei]